MSHLELVKKAFEDKESVILVGDLIVVERIEQEEIKTKSGLVIPTNLSVKQVNAISNHPQEWARILAVGEGYEDGDMLEVKPGDIVLLEQNSTNWFSMFNLPNYQPFSVGISRTPSIKIWFKQQSGYDKFFGVLNG